MHGPTSIAWANLTPFSLQTHAAVAKFGLQSARHVESRALTCVPLLADAPLRNAAALKGAIAVVLGLCRIVALYYRSSISYQVH